VNYPQGSEYESSFPDFRYSYLQDLFSRTAVSL
jgi:hypothetical protein